MINSESDMAIRKPTNPFQGRWRITWMDQWDVEDESEELKPFIEFEHSDTGQFQFGCVHGQMDCRLTQRDGQPAVEFTWDGNDETERVVGRGWAVLDDEKLNGMIFCHLGDESGFTARRVGKNSAPKRR